MSMSITTYCEAVLKAPIGNQYDWFTENETEFFWLGWDKNVDLKSKKALMLKMGWMDTKDPNKIENRKKRTEKFREKIKAALDADKKIYFVRRVRDGEDKNGVAKSKPLTRSTRIFELEKIEFEPETVIGDIVAVRN
ncbi:hypothetical protein JCM19231_5096 [Vibrio ishigakensis]|uniref:Uncharacterized protein n=1 Tax=Vibrio ishigakensis TaxID=1481914 RepID=A0A0B8NWZ6_9VIBR|nr:hypothetical protein [Vibrio ishigakensis]GAM55264.1 hypothetical protein JCM19231_5096 [Vibrio ishigakensis]